MFWILLFLVQQLAIALNLASDSNYKVVTGQHMQEERNKCARQFFILLLLRRLKRAQRRDVHC
jgi:hypothetical protein